MESTEDTATESYHESCRKRLEDLQILKETMERNICFDDEDISMVNEEMQRLHTKLAGQPVATKTVPPFLSRDMVRHRATVLSAIDNSAKCLSGSRLGRKLADKQRRLEQRP